MHDLLHLADVDCGKSTACARLYRYLTLTVAFDKRVGTMQCRVEAGIWESRSYQVRDRFGGLLLFEEWIRSRWMPYFYYSWLTQSRYQSTDGILFSPRPMAVRTETN